MFRKLFGGFKGLPGREFRSSGAYRLIKRLGEGGMGSVWLAQKIGDATFRKLMAIKLIRQDRLKDPRVLQMFFDEGRLVANLIHPNIVQVYQLAKVRSRYYIVMEYVYGKSLLEIMRSTTESGKPFPVDVGAYIAIRVARGLHYAHNKVNYDGKHLGIVHRDICPANILVSYRGIPKLTDFGVAKAATSKVDPEGHVLWGKYPYVAPEAASRRGTDPRSDIYSLGLVLFEMFTGHLAHDADSTTSLQEILAREDHEDLDVCRLREDFPTPLAAIILKMVAKNPKDRHQTAAELSSDLEQMLLQHFMFPDEERLADYLASLFPEAQKHRWY